MPPLARTDRSAATRAGILSAAERLFAEHGVHAVSNRAIAEAAGQSNNAVVGYHFGTKTDLVRALIRRHTDAIEARRTELVARLGPGSPVRDWADCLVRPVTDHLASLGSPTWFARFAAQVMTDPALRELMVTESLTSPALTEILDGLGAALPELPDPVRRARTDLCRLLIVHWFADRERMFAEQPGPHGPAWSDAAATLTDALVGIWESGDSGR